MRQFSLIPAYYEWHLIDNDTHETLHNLVDPADELYHEDGTPRSLEELTNWLNEELISADIAYSENNEYNGIWLRNEKRLDQIEEIPAAAKVMAETLYNYYIA
jgi:hypothetical protein